MPGALRRTGRHAVPARFPCELPLERGLAPHLSARAVRAAWACIFLVITAAQLGAQPGALLNLRELDASPMVAAYGCVGQARDPGATNFRTFSICPRGHTATMPLYALHYRMAIRYHRPYQSYKHHSSTQWGHTVASVCHRPTANHHIQTHA